MAAAVAAAMGRPAASEDGRDWHVGAISAADVNESRGTSGGGPPVPAQLPSSLPRGEPELISESLWSLFSLPLETTTSAVCCCERCRDGGLPAIMAVTRVVVVAGALCTGGISSLIVASGLLLGVSVSPSDGRMSRNAAADFCSPLRCCCETAASLGVWPLAHRLTAAAEQYTAHKTNLEETKNNLASMRR